MISRRAFLEAAATAGAMLVVVRPRPRLADAAALAMREGADDTRSETTVLGPLLRFGADGRVTLLVPTPEMGQGALTSAAVIIADELDVRLDDVEIALMPFVGRIGVAGRAEHAAFHQETGGSTSTEVTWTQLRRAAAYARSLLLEAAARRLGTAASQLRTESGAVHDPRTNRSLAYGALVADARNGTDLLRENNVSPKAAASRRLVGRDQRNVAARRIVLGEPIFGIDVRLPGMLHAVIVRCPFLDGVLASVDDAAAKAAPGVRTIVPIARRPDDRDRQRQVPAGVAVVAESLWQAMRAARLLRPTWDGTISASEDSDAYHQRCNAALDGEDFTRTLERGDVDSAIASASVRVDVRYYHPRWAHTCMEPHNCTADVRADRAEVWVGHQSLPGAMNAVAQATGLPVSAVTVHLQRMGTGLGRKYVDDFVMEAAIVSQAVGAPVKVLWSREDEVRHDLFNPAAAYRVRAALDDSGRLTAWHVRSAGDRAMTACTMEHPAPWVPNALGEARRERSRVPIGAWRAPQHNTAAWVIQSALDELAAAVRRDPLDVLREVYSGGHASKSLNWPFADVHPERFVKALEVVAAASGWGTPLPAGRGRGIAIHQTFTGLAAHVVEVEWRSPRDYVVHQVTSAIDCGLVVNPLGVRAQVEGGVIDGLCAAKYGHVRVSGGEVTSDNFSRYRKLRLAESPRRIETHLLDFGDSEPRGVGEVALPPVIPALTNAIFAASGIRIRRLPIAEWSGA